MAEAIRDGWLARPDTCAQCGVRVGEQRGKHKPVRKIEANHYLGYTPERWYDVQWLCHACHMKTQRRLDKRVP